MQRAASISRDASLIALSHSLQVQLTSMKLLTRYRQYKGARARLASSTSSSSQHLSWPPASLIRLLDASHASQQAAASQLARWRNVGAAQRSQRRAQEISTTSTPLDTLPSQPSAALERARPNGPREAVAGLCDEHDVHYDLRDRSASRDSRASFAAPS